MRIQNINSNLSNINVVNILFGFGLVTGIFFSNDSTMLSTIITIPYRVFSLVIIFGVIFMNINGLNRLSFSSKILIFFYFSYILKIFLSLNFDDFNHYNEDDSRYYLFSVFIVFLPLLSILLSQSLLDFNKILKLSFYVVLITAILTTAVKPTDISPNTELKRTTGNTVLNSISYGHLGTSLIILTVMYLKSNRFLSIVKYLIIFFGLFIILKSGSRSPIIALFGFIIFYLNTLKKISIKVYLIFLLLIIIIIRFWENILFYFGSMFYTSFYRLSATIIDNDSGNRNYYYEDAFKQFLNSPILGDNFVIKSGLGIGDYPHNIFLESMLAFGFIGGGIIILIIIKSLINARILIKKHDNQSWVGFLFIQFLILGLLSGSLWNSIELIVIIGILLNSKTNFLKPT